MLNPAESLINVFGGYLSERLAKKDNISIITIEEFEEMLKNKKIINFFKKY